MKREQICEEAGQTVEDNAALSERGEQKNHAVWRTECTRNRWGMKEWTGTHSKPQTLASEKRMRWSVAVQLCPLWHLFELNWSVVTDVWSIPHVARAAEWTENIQGPYFCPRSNSVLPEDPSCFHQLRCEARAKTHSQHHFSHVTCVLLIVLKEQPGHPSFILSRWRWWWSTFWLSFGQRFKIKDTSFKNQPLRVQIIWSPWNKDTSGGHLSHTN